MQKLNDLNIVPQCRQRFTQPPPHRRLFLPYRSKKESADRSQDRYLSTLLAAEQKCFSGLPQTGQ